MIDRMEIENNNERSGYSDVARSRYSRLLFGCFMQPMTVTQLSRKAGILSARCTEVLRRLRHQGFVECLNPKARSSRVYWITDEGLKFQRCLFHSRNVELPRHDFAEVDWVIYGKLCSRHRALVIKALTEPMQPSEIKRKAYRKDHTIRFSANNCRDVLRVLLRLDVVRKVFARKRAHPLYELTESGAKYQSLLRRAEKLR